MGAHDFHATAYGETAEEAYKDAVNDALYEEGHNPYNGTISTTGGFVMIPIKSEESLADWINRIIDDEQVQKWGDCACAADPDEPIDVKNGRTLWHFAGWAAC